MLKSGVLSWSVEKAGEATTSGEEKTFKLIAEAIKRFQFNQELDIVVRKQIDERNEVTIAGRIYDGAKDINTLLEEMEQEMNNAINKHNIKL